MIKAIAFDLDDTLLDTSGLLAPEATRQAFEMMMAHGLKLSLAECELHRQKLINTMSHRDVFEKLTNEFGTKETLKILPDVTTAFYEPSLPAKLPLLAGALKNIEYLKKRYHLFLVTAGSETSQLAKVRSLAIEQHFEKIFVVNSLTQKRKKEVFLQIISELQIKNNELLCVGNSLLSEIADGISVGAEVCYFEFGEVRGSIQDLPKKPTYHIKKHSELIAACKL